MSIDKILETAVSRDVITIEQSSSLQNIAVELSDPDLAAMPAEDGQADEEAFYFSSGFGDMFLALGASMIFIGLLRSNLAYYPFGYLVIACIGWGLSEIFANWKKYTLSSIIGALGFVIGGALGITLSISNGFTDPLTYEMVRTTTGLYPLIGLFGIGLSAIYYHRFLLPFSLFLAALGGIILMLFGLIAILEMNDITNSSAYLIPTFLIGVGIFNAALYFDRQDRFRTTRLSDNAFWLHLIASPLMVHTLMWQSAIWISGSENPNNFIFHAPALSIVVLIIFAILMCIALIIDRRAVLVSSLVYVTTALIYLITQSDYLGIAVSTAPILLGIGIICLGIGWQYFRRLIFKLLPLTSLEDRLPPVVI